MTKRDWLYKVMVCAAMLGAVAPVSAAGRDLRTAAGTSPIQNVVTGSWWAEATKAIEALEYNLTPDSGVQTVPAGRAYQAPNRRQDLRTSFDDKGVTLRERTGTTGPALVSLTFKGLKRGDLVQLPGQEPPAVSVVENRIEFHRQGVTEWYINGPAGLEQGFEILHRPPGEGLLRLILETKGAELQLVGDKIRIRCSTGRDLEYGKLKIADADGKDVPGHLELVAGGGFAIAMDDAGARYPLSVDPLLTGVPNATLEVNQAGAWFGFSVAGAGDVNGDSFGDVIVGAPYYSNGQANEGAAFVFLGSATGLASTPATVLEGNLSNALFGFIVAGAGDVNGDTYADVVVGAPNYSNGEVNEGAAYVFLSTGAAGISTTPAVVLESNQVNAFFGYSAAGAGNVNGDAFADVIVGAYLYDANSLTDQGAVFVYHGTNSGTGVATTPATTLKANQAGAWFGVSVAGSGDVDSDGYTDVVVGAPKFSNGQANEGAAFLFHGGSAGVATTPIAQLEVNQADAQFGYSVAGAGSVNGDTYPDVIVGAPHYNNGQSDEGAAFAFLGTGTGIATTPATLTANQAGAQFGFSVAGPGDVDGDGYGDVIVGAPFFSNGETEEGAAFVFRGGASGLATVPTVQLEVNQASAWFGTSVAGAGNVNNDGFADVIVGAMGYSDVEASEGAAFVFHGTTTHTVTATADVNGSLDTAYRTSPQTVLHGDTISFKFDADTGYHVAGVSGCGLSYLNYKDSVATYTAVTGPIVGDCTVTATFAPPNHPPSLGTLTPSNVTSGPGVAQSFTAVYSDADGYADIKLASIVVNTALNGVGSIFGVYDRAANKISLYNDAKTAFVGNCTPGSVGTLTNSQGTIDCAATTVTPSGNDLTIAWNLTAKIAFISTAKKNVYIKAQDNADTIAGWTDKGDWTVADTPPTLGAVTPSSVSTAAGVEQTFTAVYSDAEGYADLKVAYLLVNEVITGINGLYITYDRVSGKLALWNDAKTAYAGTCTPGTVVTLTNSQGSVDCATSSVVGSGNDLTMTLKITPTNAFGSGTPKNIYTYAKDNFGAPVGWTDKGDWTITGTNNAPTLGAINPTPATTYAGTAQSFTTVYSDAQGYGTLKLAYLLVNSALSGTNGLYLIYERAVGKVHLYNDARTAYIGSCVPGAAVTLTNTQGSLNCAATAVSGSGSDLTITWNVTPAAGFAGQKNLYLMAYDHYNVTVGWTDKGDWKISTATNTAPTLGAVSPTPATSSGGSPQAFSAVYSDADGYENLKTIYFLVNATLSGTNAIYCVYDRNTDKLMLYNDARTAYVGSCTPGAAGTLTNTQGSLNCAATSVSGSGNDLTVNWNITPTFTGQKNLYTNSFDYANATPGNADKGDWTIQ